MSMGKVGDLSTSVLTLTNLDSRRFVLGDTCITEKASEECEFSPCNEAGRVCMLDPATERIP
jgi:hypothetical protein